MTDKELRRMSRMELIEIIVEQKKLEINLKKQIEFLKQQLSDRTVKVANAGSIAQAALALNGVFESAQAAADTYLQSIYQASEEIEKSRIEAQKEYERIIALAEQKAAEIIK